MSKSVERYIALHNSAKQQNHDNFMKELKDTFGNLPDKDKIDEIALYLQICVKQSRPLYIHGYLLSSALHKYLLEKQPEKINILDIGTARGFSAIVMSNILKNNNIDGKIYTIDILGHHEKRKWNSIDCPNDQKISRNEILERWSYLRDNYIEFIKGNFRLNMFYHLIWKDGEKNKCAKNAIGTNQNFTLMCRLYKGFTFHPLTIKERIVNTFDYETYNLWRQNILESMDDMRVLIYVARKVLTQFNFPILYSSVSCPSSKRFCESSGLFVHRGVAFMMPLKFEY